MDKRKLIRKLVFCLNKLDWQKWRQSRFCYYLNKFLSMLLAAILEVVLSIICFVLWSCFALVYTGTFKTDVVSMIIVGLLGIVTALAVQYIVYWLLKSCLVWHWNPRTKRTERK